MEDKQQSSVNNQRRSRPGRVTRETEEEAIIRRFHDAQRMARFRAKKKKALQLEKIVSNQESEPEHDTSRSIPASESKYAELLVTIERLGKDMRLSYAGSRSSAERLKSGIAKARNLVRDCLVETRINLRQM